MPVDQIENENSNEEAEERAKVTSLMPEAGSYNIDEGRFKFSYTIMLNKI